jgi:hypothetical protein
VGTAQEEQLGYRSSCDRAVINSRHSKSTRISVWPTDVVEAPSFINNVFSLSNNPVQ